MRCRAFDSRPWQVKRGPAYPGLSPRLPNQPNSAIRMALGDAMQHPVPRQRLLDCGKCGTSKVILRNGASRRLACHNRRGREYYHRSATRRRKQRESYVRRKYGLSIELLQGLLHQQAGRCAICVKRWQDSRRQSAVTTTRYFCNTSTSNTPTKRVKSGACFAMLVTRPSGYSKRIVLDCFRRCPI